MFSTAFGLLAVAICVALNAFFVAAEFALVTVRHTWVEEVVRRGARRADDVKQAVAKLDDTIAATQLGITIASIALGWLGEPAIARLVSAVVGPPLHGYPAAAHSLATVIAFGLITFLHVVLGELAPKAVALGQPEDTALATARPLLYFQRAFRPVIWAMNGAGNMVVRRLGFAPATEGARVHSVGELKQLVEETHGAGDLDPTQAEVLGRALGLRDLRVRDVMVARPAVEALDLEMSEKQILERLQSTQYTRFPVWSAKRGKFIGVANAKILLLQKAREGRIRLRDALYQPLILHHAAPLPRAIRAFKRRRQHLAFVTADDATQIGIVTLEDVLEEMVGEIEDELDVEGFGAAVGRMSLASVDRAERPSMPLRDERPSAS
jgi:CBS domain containing-hemolysin-like protein